MAARLDEGFTQLEREKTLVLEELICLRCDDIGKVDIDESVLMEIGERQACVAGVVRRHGGCAYLYMGTPTCTPPQLQEGDTASKNNPQALRQLFHASYRGPRLRRFPGQDHQPPTTPTQLQVRQPPTRPTPAQIRQALRPPPTQQELLEVELTALADQMVAESLATAASGAEIHREASMLVRAALDRSETRLAELQELRGGSGRSMPP